MFTIFVYIQVLPEFVDDFIKETKKNVEKSNQEAGILSFNFFQQSDSVTDFLLEETYVDGNAVNAHKETEHYLTWRDAVAGMMASPRKGVKYHSVD